MRRRHVNMSRMRILAVENELTSTRGGQELSLLDVCRGLSGRGHRVTLAYIAGGDLQGEYATFCERMVQVAAYSVDRRRTSGSFLELLRSVRAVRGGAPDVVYANQYLDSLFGALVRHTYRVPFVCHLRLPPPDMMCTQFRIGMSQASRLIATSEQTKRDWVNRGYPPQRVAVVLNGIDVKKYARRRNAAAFRAAHRIPPESLVIAYGGRLHPAKGVETLLEAFAQVVRIRKAHLVVAGREAIMPQADGRPRPYRAELRALAARLGVASQITWIEHQPDMPELFSASDVTVVPSRWSEPFGRVVIESMACETPAVASRVGGIAEILTGEFASWLCEPGQPDALAACLLDTVDRAAADPGVGRRARAHVASNFAVQRMVAGVEQVLLQAVRQHDGAWPASAAAGRPHSSLSVPLNNADDNEDRTARPLRAIRGGRSR
jgi:glycosyltransferase involved in cell wall biosynthesis